VVSVNSGDKDEHNFNVVNIRGTVYLVDAYNSMGIVSPNLRDHLGYARKLEFSFGWNMRIVPTDAIGKFRCPPPPPPNKAAKKKRAKKKPASAPATPAGH
jgi:hypothetical protein